MEMEKNFLAREIGRFLWSAFCDPAGVGVDLADILDGAALAGVYLTDAQKGSVIRHMDDGAETYTADEEAVRDLIADATDCEDYDRMFAWLEFVVGDILAPVMISEWRGEFSEE